MFLFTKMLRMKELSFMQVNKHIGELSKYRINKAEENIEAAKIL